MVERRTNLMILLLLLSASLAGCAAPPAAAPAAPTARAPGRPAPPRIGAQAYSFALNDLQGNPVLLSDFRGKSVMINFWATWCGPCRAEIPAMVELYDERRDQGFEILAVNVAENPANVAGFVERFDMRFPVLLDRTGKVAVAYRVRGMPTSIFVDEQGIIQATVVGALSKPAMRRYVDELMR